VKLITSAIKAGTKTERLRRIKAGAKNPHAMSVDRCLKVEGKAITSARWFEGE
jgi:hypothetical protein